MFPWPHLKFLPSNITDLNILEEGKFLPLESFFGKG